MSTLHTVNKSPFSDNTLDSCLQLCSEADCVLLIEDGTYAASSASPCADTIKTLLKEGLKFYVLENDARARGVDRLLEGIEMTDYQGFVRLSCEHNCIQSWY